MTQVVKGSSVEVKSEGEWCDATVLKVRDHKIKVHYVGGKQEDEWITWISGRLRLPKSTATGDFSRIYPQTRPANMKRHAAHWAAVHGVSGGGVSEGEAVKGIGAGGDAGGRPPVLDEGAVDVVGDKTKQHKGRPRLENSELFFVFFSFSDVFRDAEGIKKLMLDVCFTRMAMHTYNSQERTSGSSRYE